MKQIVGLAAELRQETEFGDFPRAGLSNVAKLPNLQRWIVEKDFWVDWPPERR